MKDLLGKWNKKAGGDDLNKKNAMDVIIFKNGLFKRVPMAVAVSSGIKNVLCSNNGYFTT